MASQIIKFLRDEARDYEGRTLFQLQMLPDYKINQSLGVIQWMFPIDIPSKRFVSAPVLTAEDIAIMKTDITVKESIQTNLTRMIWYYEKDDYWITQKNHHFLNITRILRCLWLTCLTHDYVCLQRVLDEIFVDYTEIVGEETFFYWKNANNDEFMKSEDKSKFLEKYKQPELTGLSTPASNEDSYCDYGYV